MGIGYSAKAGAIRSIATSSQTDVVDFGVTDILRSGIESELENQKQFKTF